jgi:trimeric autotransporter adhesin
MVTDRSAADQVASGTSSVAIGYRARATGGQAVALGNGAVSTGIGSFAAAGGNAAGDSPGNIAIGSNCTATSAGGGAVAMGAFSTAGQSAVAIGDLVSASGINSFATGRRALASRQSERAHCAEGFEVAGSAQTSNIPLARATTDTTVSELWAGGVTNFRAVLANYATWEFEARILARQQGARTPPPALFGRGLITRDANAASTAIVGSIQTVGSDIGSNAGAPPAGWDVTITADTTNGSLKVEVTGAAATNIRWVCDLRFTQTIYQ